MRLCGGFCLLSFSYLLLVAGVPSRPIAVQGARSFEKTVGDNTNYMAVRVAIIVCLLACFTLELSCLVYAIVLRLAVSVAVAE
jgi:hypothetical protein